MRYEERTGARLDPLSEQKSEDPAADIARELATRPPIKDIASIKAASDVYEASHEQADHDDEDSPDR